MTSIFWRKTRSLQNWKLKVEGDDDDKTSTDFLNKIIAIERGHQIGHKRREALKSLLKEG
jgi:hypothetical protein